MNNIKVSTEYLVGYAKVLREAGGPHQQDLAAHIEAVTSAGPAIAEHAGKDAKIEELEARVKNLQDNMNVILDERDAARAELRELKALAELKSLAGEAKQAEESHASLKKRAKHS